MVGAEYVPRLRRSRTLEDYLCTHKSNQNRVVKKVVHRFRVFGACGAAQDEEAEGDRREKKFFRRRNEMDYSGPFQMAQKVGPRRFRDLRGEVAFLGR